MTNVARELKKFYKSFDIPAYEEHSVPDDATLPYITYELKDPDWRDFTTISANVWYSGTGFGEITKKVDEIADRIGEGLRLPVESGGCIWLYKSTPFAQMIDTEYDNVKVVYLLIGMHAMCK